MNNKINSLIGEACRDAGNVSLQALQKAAGASPVFGRQQLNLEGFPLRDVVNDTRSRGFCGPTAVASIVAQPISIVRDAFRFVRHGYFWVEFERVPAIRGTWHCEVEAVLEIFGFRGQWRTVTGRPTLAAFLERRQGDVRTHPCIIEVTGHWVAVCGWQFCDTRSKGQVIEADDARGRRARVKKVFVITGRQRPASSIPRKDYSGARANLSHILIGRGGA